MEEVLQLNLKRFAAFKDKKNSTDFSKLFYTHPDLFLLKEEGLVAL